VRRGEILTAAERLFVAHGYEGTSLEKIASGASYSVGAIYNFFPSKDAVYLAVLERNAAALAQRLGECAAAPGSGLERLIAMAATVIREVRANPDRARLTYGSLAPGRDASARETATRPLLDAYAVAIRDGQGDGTVRAGEPELLAYYVGGLVTAHLAVDAVISRRPAGVDLDEFIGIVRVAFELRSR
jgi:AcrR family transcriptional regulator